MSQYRVCIRSVFEKIIGPYEVCIFVNIGPYEKMAALHYVFVGSKTYTIENANFFPHAPILLKHGSF